MSRRATTALAKTLPRLDSARRQGVLPLEFGTSERGA